jgi:glycine betaine/proline transport system substrate-binding protein
MGIMQFALLCALSIVLVFAREGGSQGLQKKLTIGTPGVSFHRVANWVVVRAMERLGYNVTVIDQKPHRLEYPLFTDLNGPIDIFTGSDLPWNHAPWLWNHTDQFRVVGTMNEATDISLGAPSYTGVSSVREFMAQRDKFNKTIYSLERDNCPECVSRSDMLAKKIGFTVQQLDPISFISTVKKMIMDKTFFAVSWYIPCWIVGELPGIKILQGDVEPFNHHSVGKTLIRRDRMAKLDAIALSVLSAIFVGNEAITKMDRLVNKQGLSPDAAADQWIANNSATFESFFGKLS